MAKAVTSNPPAAADLKADGRRYLPELVRGDIVLAHLHRYGLVELRADQRVNDADKLLLSKVCELIATIAGPESAALKGYLTSSWYRANNLDVTEAGNDLVEHWFIEGAKEGRIPALNLKAVLQDVVSERESTIRQSLREAIVELQNAKKESLDRERDLEAEIEAAHRERRTIAAHLTASVERERNFTAQVLEETQQAAVRREADETEARHAEREWLLRDERQHIERETVEKLQRLERELVQTRSRARDEVNAVLVGMAARERGFIAEFSRQQELIDQERQHVRSQFLAIWDDLIAWIASLKRAPLHEKFALLRPADGILPLKLIRNRFAAPDES
jgi:hypothetical protein